MTRPTARDWILMLSLGLIWGGSFVSVSLALESFAPLQIAALRIAIAAIIVTGASYLMGHGLPPVSTPAGRRTWGFCLGMAVFSNALPFSLLSWAQQNVSSGFAGISMAVIPLTVLPLAHFFVAGDRMAPQKLLGVLLGFAGIVILIGPGNILAGSGHDLETLARLACIASSVSYAVGHMFTRNAPAGPALAFSSAALILAALIMLPLAFARDPLPGNPEPIAVLALLYLGVLPTAAATIMLVMIIKSAGPSFLSLVNYQVPVWAVLLGTAFLGEQLPGSFVISLALILLGVAIAQGRFRSRGAQVT